LALERLARQMEDYHNQDPAGEPTLNQRWTLYRIISRHSWERLQSHKECHPGASIEHLEHGLYVLKVPGGEPCPCEAGEARRRVICPRSARAVWEGVGPA
jgi:hypothetical protein